MNVVAFTFKLGTRTFYAGDKVADAKTVADLIAAGATLIDSSLYPAVVTAGASAQTERLAGRLTNAEAIMGAFYPPNVATTAARSFVDYNLWKPVGGGASDVANLRTLLALGKPIVCVASASYVIDAQVIWPAGAILYGEGATWNCAVPPIEGYSGAPIYAFQNAGSNPALTLAADVTVGTNSFTVTATTGLSVGGYVAIGSGTANCGQTYRIVSIAGASNPFTVTVDRPINYPFTASGYTAKAVVPTKGIRIHGNGLTLVGSGDRAIELAAAYECVVEDVDIFSASTSAGGGFGVGLALDVNSFRSVVRNVSFDGAGYAAFGVMSESNEECVYQDISVSRITTGGPNSGLYAYTGRNNEYRNFRARNCSQHGAMLDYSASTPGFVVSEGCKVFGGDYSGNGGHGIVLTDGAKRWTLSGGTSNRNTLSGVRQDTIISGAPTENTIENWTAANNTVCGIQLSAGDKTKIVGCNTPNNGSDGVQIANAVTKTTISAHTSHENGSASAGYGVNCLGDCLITGLSSHTATAVNAGAIGIQSSANVIVEGAELSGTFGSAASWFAINHLGSGDVRVNGIRVTVANGNKFAVVKQASGNVYVDNLKLIVGAGNSTGLIDNGGAGAIVLGNSVDVSAAGTPYSTVAGRANFGTLTLNGTTQVDTNGFFPSDAKITLSLRTVGSTPGTGAPYFSAAQTANHFFLKSPTASANDVYNWHARW